MGIMNFLYEAEIPNADNILDTIVKVLVAEEENYSDVRKIVQGLFQAYEGILELEDENDTMNHTLISNEEADQVWFDTYLQTYSRKLYGRKQTDESLDGIGWLPDSMEGLRWTATTIKAMKKIARTLAEIEAEKTKAFYRYCQQEEAA
jgi:hypothetical protein